MRISDWSSDVCSSDLATVWIFGAMPKGFIPPLDRGYAIVVMKLPDGATLDRTDQVVQKATKIAQSIPGVAHVVAIPGFDGSTFTNSSNSGVMFTTFKTFEERLATEIGRAHV